MFVQRVAYFLEELASIAPAHGYAGRVGLVETGKNVADLVLNGNIHLKSRGMIAGIKVIDYVRKFQAATINDGTFVTASVVAGKGDNVPCVIGYIIIVSCPVVTKQGVASVLPAKTCINGRF